MSKHGRRWGDVRSSIADSWLIVPVSPSQQRSEPEISWQERIKRYVGRLKSLCAPRGRRCIGSANPEPERTLPRISSLLWLAVLSYAGSCSRDSSKICTSKLKVSEVDWLIAAQRWLYGGMAESMRSTSDMHGLPSLIAIAFVFGTSHALMPGHGKSVLVSYHLGRRSRLVEGIATGVLLASTHVGIAILFVIAGVAVISRSLAAAGRAPAFQALSGALIARSAHICCSARSGHRHTGKFVMAGCSRSQRDWSHVPLPPLFSRTHWRKVSWLWVWQRWEECWPV